MLHKNKRCVPPFQEKKFCYDSKIIMILNILLKKQVWISKTRMGMGDEE